MDGHESPSVAFADIPNFPGYRAGTDGSLWTCWKVKGTGHAMPCKQVMSDTWKQLKGAPRKKDGRLRYTLKRGDGKLCRKYGSHFVLFAFVGPRPDGMEACHDDGNCLNNAKDNLRWDTHQANADDKQRHGTQVSGENHPKTKVTDEQIQQIIVQRREGKSLGQIAAVYGITIQRVHQICKKGQR